MRRCGWKDGESKGMGEGQGRVDLLALRYPSTLPALSQPRLASRRHADSATTQRTGLEHEPRRYLSIG